jgi:hypothetical protein
MTDTNVENAILRGSLYLAASALREYHDAPHFEIDDDGPPKREVIVREGLREKAADALERADQVLRQPEDRGRS